MKNLFSYRLLVGAFIALFFALQSFSLAHAVTHGDAPHDHEGIACAVTVLSDNHVVIAPPPLVKQTALTEQVETDYPDFTSVLYLSPQGRAPPPRAPPVSN